MVYGFPKGWTSDPCPSCHKARATAPSNPLGRECGSCVKRRSNTQTSRILAALKQAPDRRNVDIASELGVARSLVSTVRQRNGLVRKNTPPALGSPLLNAKAIHQHPGLADWLAENCPQGSTMPEFVAAVLADAMNEDS